MKSTAPTARKDQDISNSRARYLMEREWYELLEGDERPGEADQAGVVVGVTDQLPPHHDEDQLRHHARRRHCRRHYRERANGRPLDHHVAVLGPVLLVLLPPVR